MSAISAVSSFREPLLIKPFCDQNFQSLRVLAKTIESFCLSVFHTMASYGSYLFKRSSSHCYQVLSNNYWQKTLSISMAYFRHGSQIVDFSANI